MICNVMTAQFALALFLFVIGGVGDHCLAAGRGRVLSDALRLPLDLPISGYGLVPALADLVFDSPVAIASPPGETNRLFILERGGRIVVVTNLANPTKTVFLDLSDSTYSGYVEAGLLGLAFHPGYQTNGYFFVFRSLIRTTPGNPSTLHQQVSRFRASPVDPNQALPDSELVLIAQADDSPEHNAGALAFGPDGYLYIGFGDESPPTQDHTDEPQAIDNDFFGAIARIDVDSRPGSFPPHPHAAVGSGYLVPADNPYVQTTEFNGNQLDPSKVRTEFYAIGFRNPWRMSFDPATGDLYCGDVGSSTWEEIDLVEKGANYGWPYLEGNAGLPPPFETVPPILTYGHGYDSQQGCAVIGGVVSHGQSIPALDGAYIFGDFVSGNIWSLRRSTNAWDYLTSERGVAAFGIDPRNGDVLLVNHTTGRLKRLIYVPPEEVVSIPQTLADTGIFADLQSLQIAPGFTPYSINVPFWSDGALKSRWFCVSDANSKIQFQPSGNWSFPAGTIWVKHFDLQLNGGVPGSIRRIETRVLVKNDNGVYGLTYRWGGSLTNAILVPASGLDESFVIQDGGIGRTQTWHYPSQDQCLFCHTAEAGFALGFNTAQLNRPESTNSSRNQLEALQALGCFAGPMAGDSTGFPKLAMATSEATPLGFRARSYLSANCSECHQPGAPAGAAWDARITTPLPLAGMVEAPAQFSFIDTTNLPLQIIAPRRPEASMILQWMNRRGIFQMPPTSTTLVDSNGVQLITDWINSFPPAPWQDVTIGSDSMQGYSSFVDGSVTLGAPGTVSTNDAGAIYFLYRPLQEAGQLVARVPDFQSASGAAKAGLMCRLGLDPGAPFIALWQGGDGLTYLQRRAGLTNELELITLPSASFPQWLRMARQEADLVIYVSNDRQVWSVAAVLPVGDSGPCLVGPALWPGQSNDFTTASFQNLEFASMILTQPIGGQTFVTPGTVLLQAEAVESMDESPIIEFLADGQTLGVADMAPYILNWKNPSAGPHQLQLKMTDSSGTATFSPNTLVNVVLGPAVAQFLQTDTVTQNGWTGVYGSEEYLIPGRATPQQSLIGIGFGSSLANTNSVPRTEPSIGESAAGPYWSSSGALSLRVQFDDAKLHQVALYFADPESAASRIETVQISDASTGNQLDARTVQSFSKGRFLSWAMRGNLRIDISEASGRSVVLNGIFIDPFLSAPPSVVLRPLTPSTMQLPASVALIADVSDPTGVISRVQYFDGNLLLGTVTGTPFILSWTSGTVGVHQLFARAFDDLGNYSDSAPVSLTLTSAAPAVQYVGADPVTSGDWISRYSRFLIPGAQTNLPASVSVQVEKGDIYVWAPVTNSVQALLNPNGPERIASAWFGDEIQMHLDFLDGAAHSVAVYLLDWEGLGRTEMISFLDEATGAVLDRRTVSNFELGTYFIWNIQGGALLQIEPWNMNAVVSGLFFEPINQDSITLRWLPASNPLTLALLGPANKSVVLTASNDMQQWTTVRTELVPPEGVLFLTNLVNAATTPAFYRAQVLPPSAGPAP